MPGKGTHHNDRRGQTQRLFHARPSVNHVIDHVQRSSLLEIPTPNPVLLLPDFGQDLWVLRHALEQEDDGRSHGVLRGEQEGEDDHGDLVIGVFPGEHPTLFLFP